MIIEMDKMTKTTNMTALETFVASPALNGWVNYNNLNIYLRFSVRLILGKRTRVIDLASVGVTAPKYEGKGHFSTMLKELEQLCVDYKFEGIFVENVMSARMVGILHSKDYIIIPYDIIPCFYKHCNEMELSK